jgi:hypothetical protein
MKRSILDVTNRLLQVQPQNSEANVRLISV